MYLCYYTAELLSSCRRPSSIHPSVVCRTHFLRTCQAGVKFGGKVPFHHISRPFFFFFKNFAFLIIYFFFFVVVDFVNMAPTSEKKTSNK